MLLLSLIGEQPIPNLLPMRSIQDVTENLLVHTSLDASQKAAKRLQRLAPGSRSKQIKEAYPIPEILEELRKEIGERNDVIVNLTGGTKPMSLAAFELARIKKLACVYYQTEGPRGRDQKGILYFYRFGSSDNLELDKKEEVLGDKITLDDYLKAHMDDYEEAGYSRRSGGELEKATANALKGFVDEIRAGIKPKGIKEQAEIDLLIRCGNHVAVLEVKTGGSGSGKHAVDQLTTIAARESLGTYAARFLVTQDSQEDRYKALASILHVGVVELKEYRSGNFLSQKDTKVLRDAIATQIPIRQT